MRKSTDGPQGHLFWNKRKKVFRYGLLCQYRVPGLYLLSFGQGVRHRQTHIQTARYKSKYKKYIDAGVAGTRKKMFFFHRESSKKCKLHTVIRSFLEIKFTVRTNRDQYSYTKKPTYILNLVQGKLNFVKFQKFIQKAENPPEQKNTENYRKFATDLYKFI